MKVNRIDVLLYGLLAIGIPMRYSWLDLIMLIAAIVLLVPLVMRLVESVMSCLE